MQPQTHKDEFQRRNRLKTVNRKTTKNKKRKQTLPRSFPISSNTASLMS